MATNTQSIFAPATPSPPQQTYFPAPPVLLTSHPIAPVQAPPPAPGLAAPLPLDPPVNLSNLPLDFLFCIRDHLPPSDLATLAITSRNLYVTFGREYRSCISGVIGRPAYTSFLTRYAQDLPDHFFCSLCEKLHPNEVVAYPNANPPPNRVVPAVLPPCATRQLPVSSSPRGVYFSEVQVAMKQAKFGGNHGMHVSAFMSTELKPIARWKGYDFKFTAVHSFEARIVAGELVLRTQIWIRIPASKQPTAGDFILFLDTILSEYHTGHASGFQLSNDTCAINHILTDHEGFPRGSRRPNRTPTATWSDASRQAFVDNAPYSCETATVHFARKNTAIGITTYTNYGNGIAPQNLAEPKILRPIDRTNFESLPGESLQALSARNEELLFREEVLQYWTIA